MEKLLHERLRDNDGILCPIKAFKGLEECPNDTDCKTCRKSALKELADEIEKCYIPRPRFEDGEVVPNGDDFVVDLVDGNEIVADANFVVAALDGSCVYLLSDYDGYMEEGDYRFKRPAPNVLDADGVPCKSNDEVWSTNKDGVYEDGDMMIVVGIDAGVKEKQVLVRRALGGAGEQWVTAKYLTHEKPVFDAEGKRICKGDTVWGTLLGDKHEVPLVKNGYVYLDDGSICFEPNQLTHQEPDSLERILDDATKDPRVYYNDYIGHDVGLHDDAFIIEKFAQHLIKRAALIERGA